MGTDSRLHNKCFDTMAAEKKVTELKNFLKKVLRCNLLVTIHCYTDNNRGKGSDCQKRKLQKSQKSFSKTVRC
ncbi:MAG: hypothetical protein J6A10_07210, partial [Peptococcaceae bacterium]|nr:hypothetical protein [Peptococcaceae bacterium]